MIETLYIRLPESKEMIETKTTPTKTAPLVKGLPLSQVLFNPQRDIVGFLNQRWQEAGDVFSLSFGPRRMAVINDPKLAQEALIEKKHIFQRPKMVNGGSILSYLLDESVLTVDGEVWLTRRRMMQPIFHRQRIQGMFEQMAAGGRDMLARWQALPPGARVNLGEEMKLVTLDIINRTMFSSNVLPEVERIGDSVEIGLHYINNRTRSLVNLPESWPTPANRKFRAARRVLDEYLYKLIAERRRSDQHPGDLLDMLLAARDEESGAGMDDHQVRNEVATIYGAGHETTAVALSWAWYALNQHPDKLQRLQAEVDSVLQGRQPGLADMPNLPYALAVFEETLRLFPPVPMTVRLAEQDTTLGGYAIPAGSMLNINIYNIHRHPAYWPQAAQFQPERFLPENKAGLNRSAYLPFLSGPHLCIGNSFALLEGPLLLTMMAQRWEVKLLPGQTVERDLAVTMRPRGGLLARVTPRGEAHS